MIPARTYVRIAYIQCVVVFPLAGLGDHSLKPNLACINLHSPVNVFAHMRTITWLHSRHGGGQGGHWWLTATHNEHIMATFINAASIFVYTHTNKHTRTQNTTYAFASSTSLSLEMHHCVHKYRCKCADKHCPCVPLVAKARGCVPCCMRCDCRNERS